MSLRFERYTSINTVWLLLLLLLASWLTPAERGDTWNDVRDDRHGPGKMIPQQLGSFVLTVVQNNRFLSRITFLQRPSGAVQ